MNKNAISIPEKKKGWIWRQNSLSLVNAKHAMNPKGKKLVKSSYNL